MSIDFQLEWISEIMKGRRFLLVTLIAVLSLIVIRCGEKRSLPTGPVDTGPGLAAGDTVYTRIRPDWPEGQVSLNTPADLIVNRDGYIFLADQGNRRVLVFNKSGEIIQSRDDFGNAGFDDLREIPAYDAPAQHIAPTGLAVDARMNLFVVDSSNHVYVWNQYVNNVGIDSVATGFSLLNTESGNERAVSASEYWRSYTRGDSIVSIQWSTDPGRIDSLLRPRMFFSTAVPAMLRENYGQSPEASRFNAVAAWRPQNLLSPERDGTIYLADASFYNRIVRVDYRRYRLVTLSTGQRLWLHRGRFHSFAASRGTGAGTVNKPTGLYFNYFEQDPKLYFSQLGENFHAHRISLTTRDFDLPETADMMDLDRLQGVRDITADDNGHIFVTNTRQNVVEEFSPNGAFRRYVGTSEQIIDTTYTDTVIVGSDTSYTTVDTSLVRQIPDVLNSPGAVAASDGIIYVADSGNNRVVRFQLSTDVRIDIEPQE